MCTRKCYGRFMQPGPGHQGDHYDYGPIRTSGQVLNVITFLTKTKFSRQVGDILKKTKGVIIITIALHMLLASWYIARHGRLLQISNNQAGPRGEKF